MGRKERRAIARSTKQQIDNANQQERMAKFFRNGITDADLEDSYNKGHKAGVLNTYSMVFAACILTLSELYGFGHDRCARVIDRIYYHILYTLDSAELIQTVYDRTGIEITTDDALQPVIRKHPKKKHGEKIYGGKLRK